MEWNRLLRMKLSLRAVVGLSSALVCLCVAAEGQTAEDLVARNIEAKGGMANIKAIGSLRKTGRLEVQGIVVLLGSDQKPENLFRQTSSIQGMTQIQAYNGSEGWQINPFQGRRDPEMMGEDDTREMVENSDFYGPLVDYSKKGSKVEFVGHAPVDGDDALLLKVTLKNGDIVNYFLDPDTFLEIRTERQVFVRGSVHETFNNLGSYKKVNGVYFPFSMESGATRNPGSSVKITYSKIEANAAIPDSEFNMPPAGKQPAHATAGSGETPKPSR